MSDPQPATQPEPKQSKRSRNLINKALNQTISRTEKVIATARLSAYAAILAEHEIDDAFLAALQTDCQTASTIIGSTVNATGDRAGATANETSARRALMAAVRTVQSAARQKYGKTNRGAMIDYMIGTRLGQNRAQIEHCAATVLNKLASDKLPGINPDKLAAALQTYRGIETVQAAAQSSATSNRAALEALIEKIDAARRQILLAVETAWPPDNAANAGLRAEFGLPPRRHYLG